MKNVTLSMPDDLLSKSREYALMHGSSLNQFIRDMLKMIVENQDKSNIQKLLEKGDNFSINTKSIYLPIGLETTNILPIAIRNL